ncbi:hypothetical protein CLOP_g16865 [Closterium sp. NIES-67]|nr:hypothetical protein CLOP_g13242 [Closterium sp. NIES-67]GJP86893.1 hypothetical protein CLOP_g16865 [Closterium sp. NIES-67]
MPIGSPIQRLSDDLLTIILHLVAQPDGQLQHALVCKEWHGIACRVQTTIHIREKRQMTPHDLLSHLSAFLRLPPPPRRQQPHVRP